MSGFGCSGRYCFGACGAVVCPVRDVQSRDRGLDRRGCGGQRLEPCRSRSACPSCFDIRRIVRCYLSLQELSGTQRAVDSRMSLSAGLFWRASCLETYACKEDASTGRTTSLNVSQLPAHPQRDPECHERSSDNNRILSDSTGANRRSSRVHDRRRNQLKFVLDLVPGLPHWFQGGSEQVYWNGLDKAGLFRNSHITHDTGDYDCASDSGHADASTPRPLHSPPPNRALDLPAVALCLGNRRDCLSDAIPLLPWSLDLSRRTLLDKRTG